jgi:hypothetical protein
MLLTVIPMDQQMNRQPPSQAQLRSARDSVKSQFPPDAKVDLPHAWTCRWKSFDITVLETMISEPSGSMVMFGAYIPLRKGSLQLDLAAPAWARDRAAAYLVQVVQGVKGESNWAATPGSQTNALPKKRILLLGALVVVFLVIMCRRHRPNPKAEVPSAVPPQPPIPSEQETPDERQ